MAVLLIYLCIARCCLSHINILVDIIKRSTELGFECTIRELEAIVFAVVLLKRAEERASDSR